MGNNFVRSVMILTILLGLVLMVVVGVSYGLPSGLAVFAGAAWGTINLYLIKLFIENLATQNAKSYWNIALLFGIKFPLLYLVGFGLFKVGYLPTLSLLLGFSLFFISIILRGFWAWIFGTKQVVDGHRE